MTSFDLLSLIDAYPYVIASGVSSVSGKGLPTGLSYNYTANAAADGTPSGSIGGTPTEAGSFVVAFTATNGISPDGVSADTTLNVNGGPDWNTITVPTLTKDTAMTDIDLVALARAFPTPTISVTAGTLPAGITLSSGTLSGTPTCLLYTSPSPRD